MISYVGHILFFLLIIFAFESGIAPQGNLADDAISQYWLALVMELFIVFIPLALYLFKIHKVANDLKERKEKALLLWGVVRMDMITLPLIGNGLFYEMTLSPTFGYLAIIFFLSLFFITPTMKRCEAEVGMAKGEE